MPAVQTSIEFLAKLQLYETEKPYLLLPGKDQGLDPDVTRLDNLEFERRDGILVRDMRDDPSLDVNDCGFEYYTHHSQYERFDAAGDIDGYKLETQELLKERFSAVKVLTYEARLRRNQKFDRKEFDIYDPLLIEGPAKGAHNGTYLPNVFAESADDEDVTYTSGPKIIQRYLSEEDQVKYFQDGYRIRIFNTWRTLNSTLEDRPLALCDSQSVAPEDLIAADRILPDRVGEVYYLHHNPNQQWYWLEKQKSMEPFIFLMYDTVSRNAARFCPHVSFENPNRPANAEPRSSIETRSIVITADG